MELTRHRVSNEDFAALAAGHGGSKAVDQLAAAEYSKHVLLIQGVIDAAHQIGHDQADQATQAHNLLIAVQEQHPDAVKSVIRHPAVGAWARRTLGSLLYRTEPQGTPADLARLSAAAAIRAGTDFTICVPALDDALSLPSVGRLALPAGTESATLASTRRGIAVYDGMLRVTASVRGLNDLSGWQPTRTMILESGELGHSLVIDDTDPYRMPAASPAERLTAAEFFLWQERLAQAWTLLVKHHRPTAIEVRHAIRVVTPLRRPQSGIRSMTSHETFGSVGMSLPSNGLSGAVTLAHEVQHAKLTALLDQMTLTLPDDGRRFYAPWRDDPRPAVGLLQGAYAYLGVTGFWRRQRFFEKGDQAILAHAEFARWRAAVREALEVLSKSGRLTPEGAKFVAGMSATINKWQSESVPAPADRIAQHRTEGHRAQWDMRNLRNTSGGSS